MRHNGRQGGAPPALHSFIGIVVVVLFIVGYIRFR